MNCAKCVESIRERKTIRNAMRQLHRLEIIRFECTLVAAVSNSVISGQAAYNGYQNGIKHNASINVNNNRAVGVVNARDAKGMKWVVETAVDQPSI